MTLFPPDRVYNRLPMLSCDRCGVFVDLDASNIEATRATWLTVRGEPKRHYCPACREHVRSPDA